MKLRVLFLLKYFLFWTCTFIIAKLAFLFYQHAQSFALSPGTWLNILVHGLKLDISMAGYFTLLPGIVLLFTAFLNYKPAYTIINIYTVLIIIVFLLITLVDLELYKYWGVRLDSTPLRFLAKPKETLASTSLFTLIFYFAAFSGLTWLLYRIYHRLVSNSLASPGPAGFRGALMILFITAALFIPIRGGFGVSPVNTGSVYFSKTAFANHAAINVVWNFSQTLIEGKETENPYSFYATGTFEERLESMYKDTTGSAPMLKSRRPNIILIVMESFSAKLIEPLGGAKGVTPRFNALCKEGILFSHIFSTDSRTDKGLATVISGYPVLEAIPILQYAEKTQNLPFISKSLGSVGYHSSFLYGGDVDFANIRSYLHNGDFSNIISDTEFKASLRTGKWGVPDQYAFDRFITEIKADTGHWFRVMLTLTNHEPFEIPGHPKFGHKTLADKFYSSAYYADSCLGDFIDKVKASGLWENSLIIVVADHGSRLPDFDEVFEPRKHHIPLLWTGGAVKSDTVVSKTGSQADIAVTLLKQLNIPVTEYVLGKDLLAPGSASFAYYSIKNGIAMLTDSSGFGYDFTTGNYSYTYGKLDSTHLSLAKSFQQYVFGHYLKLSER